MKMPRVSVCIPAYNSAALVGDAVRSVLAQDFADYELLVVDNASSDATGDVIRGFADPRVRYSRNDRNLGFAGNLNRCLELAAGDSVAFLCADDFWLPGALRRLVEALEADGRTLLAHAGHRIVSADGATLETRVYPWPALAEGAVFRGKLLDWNIRGICLSSVLFRREAAVRLGGFDESLKFCPDLAFWLRLSARGPFAYVAEPLAAYRIHAGNLTWDFQRDGTFALEKLDMVERAFADPELGRLAGDGMKRRYIERIARKAALGLPLMRAASASREDVDRLYRLYAERCPGLGAWPAGWLALRVARSRPLSRLALRLGQASGIVPRWRA